MWRRHLDLRLTNSDGDCWFGRFFWLLDGESLHNGVCNCLGDGLDSEVCHIGFAADECGFHNDGRSFSEANYAPIVHVFSMGFACVRATIGEAEGGDVSGDIGGKLFAFTIVEDAMNSFHAVFIGRFAMVHMYFNDDIYVFAICHDSV